VSTSTVPIFDAFGHSAGSEVIVIGATPGAEVSPIWAGVQAARPLAEAGLTAIPWGRVTVASFRSASCSSGSAPTVRISPSTSFSIGATPSGWGMWRSNSRPVGASATLVVGLAAIVGSKGRRLQPSRPIGVPSASWE
jgi:hypothetical protein